MNHHSNKRKERQQKLHDSLINMLYAPPSPPSPHAQFDDQTLNFAREIVNSDHHQINTDESEEENKRGELESSENEEQRFQKLTRAQRKRLRKNKLKEAGLQRRPIIGPVLPGDDQLDGDQREQHPEGVRRNASEKPESGNDCDPREKPSCIKVKHRRMSKKKATDKPTTSHEATSHGDQD